MHVEVDRDRCEGNAVCVGIAPDLFDLDDEDYGHVATFNKSVASIEVHYKGQVRKITAREIWEALGEG